SAPGKNGVSAPGGGDRCLLRGGARSLQRRPAGLLPRSSLDAPRTLGALDGARRARPLLHRSQAQAAAHRGLPALGLAALPHLVRLRFDAAAVVPPLPLLPPPRPAPARATD